MFNVSSGTLGVSKIRYFSRVVLPFFLGTSFFIAIAVALIANGATASASASVYTYLVPSQYETIQSAVDAAYGGETILVSDGVYSEKVDFKGKQNLTVKSLNGPDVTTIQGDGRDGYVISFVHGENSDVALEGFTIDNQYFYDHTGGVLITNGSSPDLRNLHVKGNSLRNSGADHFGGGIKIDGGGATITDSIIGGTGGGNSGDMGGGGIFATTNDPADSLTIIDSQISNNSSISNGGGIYAKDYDGTITVTGSSITSNSISSGYGAGIFNNASAHMYLTDTDVDDNVSIAPYSTHHGAGITVGGGGSVTFSNGSISGNSVNRGGGAVHVKDAGSSFTADQCVMAGNRSGGDSSGGAMILTGGTVSLTNCMITGNITGTNYWSSGGGIYNAGATLNIQHSTIAGNWAKKRGGGIYTGTGTTTCDGCLFWNNEALDANTDDVKGETGNTTMHYSAIKSGSGYTGSNNITSISGSVFVNSMPATNGNPTKGGDYHIVPDAAEAINSANPASPVTGDIDGQVRTDSINDMGADELGSGCTGEEPDLELNLENSRWASYADYQARNLSVDYRINNIGSSIANDLEVEASTATNGVYNVTSMPLNLGSIGSGSSATTTIKYFVPCGVSHFLSTVYATASDGCNLYHYPSHYSA